VKLNSPFTVWPSGRRLSKKQSARSITQYSKQIAARDIIRRPLHRRALLRRLKLPKGFLFRSGDACPVLVLTLDREEGVNEPPADPYGTEPDADDNESGSAANGPSQCRCRNSAAFGHYRRRD